MPIIEYILAFVLLALTSASILSTWFGSEGKLYVVRYLYRKFTFAKKWKTWDMNNGLSLTPDLWTFDDFDNWLNEKGAIGHLFTCPICLSWHVAFWLTLTTCFIMDDYYLLLGVPSSSLLAHKYHA